MTNESKIISNIDDMSDDELVSCAYNQPGGFREIAFRDMVIVAPMGDVRKALEMIQNATDEQRSTVKESVEEELESMYGRVQDDELEIDQALRFGQDVAIWFAFQVYEGNAVIDNSHLN